MIRVAHPLEARDQIAGCESHSQHKCIERMPYSQCIFEILVNLHDRRLVPTSVTIVWRAEDCDNVAFLRPVEPIHHQLVGAGNQGQTVVLVEGLGNVLAKGISSATRTDTPTTTIVGVRPEKVAHGAFVRHLLNTVDGPDVV